MGLGCGDKNHEHERNGDCKSHGSNGYHIVLQYDRNVTWQRASIPTLAKLAPNVVVSAGIDG